MEPSAATSTARLCCAHCGLPMAVSANSHSEEIYCCSACRLVALVVGKEQSEHNWNLVRLGFGTLLAMNIMMISLLLYSGSLETALVPVFRLVLLGLATPALAILLPPFMSGALRECAARNLNLDTLVACGSLTAYCVSALHALNGIGAVYFDTATMLPVLVTFGKIIESSAKTKASDLLHTLQTLLPASALRLAPSGPVEVPLSALQVGDAIQVRPGERVAVDGLILEGSSCIEEAAFTGEFMPRLCQPGERVIAGTVNGIGVLLVRAERVGSEVLLHGIVRLIDQAWRNPSRAERIAQWAAALFIPATVAVAAGSLICWGLSGNVGQGMLSALSVLVVACPCTIGIATPLATSLAIARAARAGIVVRGGSVMEEIADVEVCYFDKTGTLTEGKPGLQQIVSFDHSIDQGEILGRLATLEAVSGHVLGKAVEREAAARGCLVGSVSAPLVVLGNGMSGDVCWQGITKKVTAGSPSFVRASLGGGQGEDVQAEAAQKGADGCSIVDVAWEGALRGRLLFADTLRPDARGCMAALQRQVGATVLLSGDSYAAAASAASRAGITRVEAPRTPAQKLAAVNAGIGAGKVVAMVGDGINDAPALAAAQVGIAFGAGTDLARQAGNVAMISGSLRQVPWLIGLSRQTRRVIYGNFALSFGYNSIALGAAAAGLLHPLLAALAMVASSLTVLANSLRISRYPDEPGPEG